VAADIDADQRFRASEPHRQISPCHHTATLERPPMPAALA
jgi:hypothetical protein